MSDSTAHEQSMSDSTAVQVVAARPRKLVTVRGRVPDDIAHPGNYNLEIPKVITDQSVT